jgi:hypothetical protein
MTVDDDVTTHVYIFSDYDPSGRDILRHTRETLLKYGPRASVEFHEVAVTKQQIEELDLPTAPPKKSDTRLAKFGDTRTVELEAIPPKTFAELAENCITQHFDRDELAAMLRSEEAQRDTAETYLRNLGVLDMEDRQWCRLN